ncbi:hypothetical protein ACTFIY_010945 [Dictyostelium cf. discoideum]
MVWVFKDFQSISSLQRIRTLASVVISMLYNLKILPISPQPNTTTTTTTTIAAATLLSNTTSPSISLPSSTTTTTTNTTNTIIAEAIITTTITTTNNSGKIEEILDTNNKNGDESESPLIYSPTISSNESDDGLDYQ